MHLLHSILQSPTAIRHSAAGSFTSPDKLEVAVVRGSSIIDLLQIQDTPLGTRLITVSTLNTGSHIRGLVSFRLAGDSTDLLAIASDSGCLVIARYGAGLERIFIHPYGKSGCRRTGPGNLLRVDRWGRAILVCGLEMTRIVYVVEREGGEGEDGAFGKMKVRSPLEANRAGQVTICAEFLQPASPSANPRFVVLEQERHHSKQVLAVYEVELGLNHVVRLASLDLPANGYYELMAMESGQFVVFGEVSMDVYQLRSTKLELVAQIAAIGFVISHSTEWIQVESGELFRIGSDLSLSSIATMPPANCIATISRSFLFSASTCAPHSLYQFSDNSLVLLDSLANIAPLLSSSVHKPKNSKKEDSIYLFTCSGYSNQSSYSNCSFSRIKPGLSIRTVATSELPEHAKDIWKVFSDLYAVCFTDRTIFLRVGESIEEDSEAPFEKSIAYLHFQQLDLDSGTVAVHSKGWTQAGGKVNLEWREDKREIVAACANSRQLAVSLSDNSLIYFELSLNGQLKEVAAVRMPSRISSMALAPVPATRQRSRFIVVGGEDSVIRLLSCDPDDRMAQLALQAAAQLPTSLLFTVFSDQHLQLHVGLKSGVYVRLTVDKHNGSISNPQSRYLGPAPVRFFPCSEPGLLIAYCTKPWILYQSLSQLLMAPLNCDFTAVAPFSTLNIPNSLISISHGSFSILMVDNYELPFNGVSTYCSDYTIKKTDYCSELGLFTLVLSSNINSRIAIVTDDMAVKHTIDFDHLTVHCAMMLKVESSWYIVQSSSKEFNKETREAKHSTVAAFSFNPDTYETVLVHETDVGSIVNTFHLFCGKILLGCEDSIKLYEMGKKRLLRKCEIKMSSSVHHLDSQGLRVYAGTAHNSLMMLLFRPKENQLQCFVDDVAKRPVSALLVLDYETVMIADRMGCVSVLRLPIGLTESMEKDPAGLTSASRETLFSAPHKLDRICEFTLGEIVTGLSKCNLFLGSPPSIIYTTVSGTIGIFSPLQFNSTAQSLCRLETEMRQYPHPTDHFPISSLTGRHQLLRRSGLGQTVKGVIDGSFCLEAFSRLKDGDKLSVAGKVDKNPSDIVRELVENMNIF